MYEHHTLGLWVSMTRCFTSNVGFCDLYFMVQWFCLISWLFDVWISYFGIMSQYDTTFDLKINAGHCNLYFMVKWFCFISWRLFDIWTPYFGIMSQYDLIFELKIFVGHCDHYFMVQWFCLIPLKLFSGWTSYCGIMSQYDQTSDLKIFVGHCDLYFMIHWICLIHILKTAWFMNIILRDYESVWYNIWPQNKCRSLWSIFHGPVILPYILNSVSPAGTQCTLCFLMGPVRKWLPIYGTSNLAHFTIKIQKLLPVYS